MYVCIRNNNNMHHYHFQNLLLKLVKKIDQDYKLIIYSRYICTYVNRMYIRTYVYNIGHLLPVNTVNTYKFICYNIFPSR